MKKSLVFFLTIVNILIGIFLGSCKKESGVPVLSTGNVTSTNIFGITANISGTIINQGASPLKGLGVVWGTSQNPVINEEGWNHFDLRTGSPFPYKIYTLSPNTLYYARVFAINNEGYGYGNSVSFKTPTGITDITGNVYAMVKIGSQLWMAENLRTTKYSDGTAIPEVSGQDWTGLKTGAYCRYCESDFLPYGVLYNWYTVKTGKVCPTGWHVPTSEEWTKLIDFVGGGSIAVNVLKSAIDWWGTFYVTGSEADKFGFSALPSGFRDRSFEWGGKACLFWSSTGASNGGAKTLGISINSNEVSLNGLNFNYGLAIRCIKD